MNADIVIKSVRKGIFRGSIFAIFLFVLLNARSYFKYGAIDWEVAFICAISSLCWLSGALSSFFAMKVSFKKAGQL